MNNSTLTILAPRILMFFAVVLLASVSGLTNAQTGVKIADREMKMWKSFEPAGGGFRVSLPTPPLGTIAPFETVEDTLDMSTFVSRSTSSTYYLSYVDHPTSPKDTKAAETIFADGRTNATTNIKSSLLVSESKIALGKIPGREFVYDTGDTIVKLRLYLVKQRLYTVQLTMPQMRNLPEALVKVYQAESDKFFNSFQILENKAAETSSKGKKTK